MPMRRIMKKAELVGTPVAGAKVIVAIPQPLYETLKSQAEAKGIDLTAFIVNKLSALDSSNTATPSVPVGQ